MQQAMTAAGSCARVEVDRAASPLQLRRIVNERQPIDLEAKLLELFEILEVHSFSRGDVIRARVNEGREDQHASDGTSVRNIPPGAAIEASFITACFMDLGNVAVEGMAGAKCSAGARRVERLETAVVWGKPTKHGSRRERRAYRQTKRHIQSVREEGRRAGGRERECNGAQNSPISSMPPIDAPVSIAPH